jgi:hypothetical protein
VAQAVQGFELNVCAVCNCFEYCTHLHIEGNGERAKMQIDLRVRHNRYRDTVQQFYAVEDDYDTFWRLILC